MRVNVYTEELYPDRALDGEPFERIARVVTAHYLNSRTGLPMTNYGLRIFLKSAPDLHDSPRDDDRSAVTFWVGEDPREIGRFIELLDECASRTILAAEEHAKKVAEVYADASQPVAQSVDTAPAGVLSDLLDPAHK